MPDTTNRPTRSVTLWECDHMRPVVFVGDSWHHITHNGSVGGECGSHGYRLDVTPDDPRSLDHALHRLQRIGDDQWATPRRPAPPQAVIAVGRAE